MANLDARALELETVHAQVRICTKCELHQGRRKAVPGEGPLHARVMLVGEAPGFQEDVLGRPFVGAAGKLLDSLLESIGLERSTVFITNIVKCRPPNNRPPRKEEVTACNPYLQAQIRLAEPGILVALGNPAVNTLMGPGYSIGKVHGKLFRTKEGLLVFPSYHPAAALHQNNAGVRDILYNDFKVLKQIIDGEIDVESATQLD